MRIAICDDDELCCKLLVARIKEYASAHENQEISYTVFSSAEDLLNASEAQNGFDVYILDILMPDTNGIELGVRLCQQGDDGIIIYLTSSSEFAIDSYNAKASSYILKPVTPQQLFPALEEAYIKTVNKIQNGIIVKTKSNLVRVPLDSILYVELCHRIIVYHLAGGETVESIFLRIPFTEAIQELLTDKRFASCSRSVVVNLSHITLIENDEVIFSGNQRVYFNKKICQTIRSLWTEFWLNKEKPFH